MIPLLKFMGELVFNKNNRIAFENVSPNGILLFKETSKLLFAFGARVLTLPLPHVRASRRVPSLMVGVNSTAAKLLLSLSMCVPLPQPQDMYSKRYKGIALALRVRAAANL